MVPRTQTTTPLAFGWLWGAAAAAAGTAIAAEYGFREPALADHVIRVILIAALGVFALSRVVLLFPAAEIAGRLRRWWVDFVLLVGGGIWWAIDPADEPVILRVGAIYILALGTGAAIDATLRSLVEGIVAGRHAGLTWRIAGMLAVLALAGGLVMSLPACWASAVTGQKWEQHGMHLLNCCFTAAAAVTCTGLTPLETGEDFSLPGQAAILVLMQVGGIAAVVIGTAIGLRLGELSGGKGNRQAGRLMRWAIGLMVVAELAGAALLYSMWEVTDPVFARSADLPPVGAIDLERVWFSLFHAVSAFCNGGLTLSRDRLAGYAWHWQMYGAILPLMILGGIGAPTLYELASRVWGRLGARRAAAGSTGPSPAPALSGHARVTLWGTLVLVAAGGLALWGIESSRRLQLRYPREDTPGRLQVQTAAAGTQEAGVRRGVQRMAELPAGRRFAAAVVVSASARSGGVSPVRMDEASLTPAGRWVLMLLMLVGGGIGGTAGGVRILSAVLCVRGVVRPGRDAGASATVWAMAGGMLLLIGASTLVLLYRDVGSFEASLFESVSAACNVGLSTGLTRQLYVEAKLALILTMLIGRAIPLGLLARLGEGAGAGPAASS